MKTKTSLAFTIAVVGAVAGLVGLGTGAVLFMATGPGSPTELEPAEARYVARSARDESPPDIVRGGVFDDTTVDTEVEPRHAGAHRDHAEPRVVWTESDRAAAIEEEIVATERALAASRRISQPTAAWNAESTPQASDEALAAAIAGSSAVALGCEGEGLACRSGADCCPGLACAGGIAGYGTVGRCEAPR